MEQAVIQCGKQISDKFRRALPHLPESNAATLAKIIDMQTGASKLIDILRIICANAKMIPDPSMQGTTDIYAVPLDDINAAQELLNQIAKGM